jgi:hypothetical protein
MFRGGRESSGPPAVATDANGRAVFLGLAAGTWQVEITHPDYMSYVAVVQLDVKEKPQITASFLEATETASVPIQVRLAKARGGPASPPLPESETRFAPATPAVPANPSQPQPEAPRARAAEPMPPTAPAGPANVPAPAAEPAPVVTAPAEPRPAVPEPPAHESPALMPMEPEPTAPPATPEPATPPAVAQPSPLEPMETRAPPKRETPAIEAPAAAEEPAVEPLPAEAPASQPPVPAVPVPTPPAAQPPVPAQPVPAPVAPSPGVVEAPPVEPTPPPAPEEGPIPEPSSTPAQTAPLPTPPAQSPAAQIPSAQIPSASAPAAPRQAPPPPPPPAWRSYRQRTCPECRAGEWAVTVAADLAGSASCDERAADAAAAGAGGLGARAELELAGFAGALNDGVALVAEEAGRDIAVRLSAAAEEGCRLLGIVLPKSSRFVGFQYEVEGAQGRQPCLPGEACPDGARFAGPPRVTRGPAATIVHALVHGDEGLALMTVYFRAPNDQWAPDR